MRKGGSLPGRPPRWASPWTRRSSPWRPGTWRGAARRRSGRGWSGEASRSPSSGLTDSFSHRADAGSEKTGGSGILRRPETIEWVVVRRKFVNEATAGSTKIGQKEDRRGRKKNHRSRRRHRGAGGGLVPRHPEGRRRRLRGPRPDQECGFRQGGGAQEAGRGGRGGRHRRCGEPEESVSRRPWGVLRDLLLGALFPREGAGGGEEHGRRGEARRRAARHLVDPGGYAEAGPPRRPPHADPHGEIQGSPPRRQGRGEQIFFRKRSPDDVPADFVLLGEPDPLRDGAEKGRGRDSLFHPADGG